ncbi:GNAT family N-acetyltransferase [Motiliproteus sp. SC1-56]|uniref:GNAT family N-acetyltransferase n=1 Tax=Motiliproteus sp. SC1-56 TaxID=2799565 RepID=UPI001A8F5844
MAIQFAITEDPKWLEVYYQIREACFREDLGLAAFNGGEDQFDRDGVILVALDGDRVIGGIRLSAGRSRAGTPLQHEGVDIPALFPQLRKSPGSYCQLTRLALLPEYRNLDTVKQVIQASAEFAAEQGFDYAFNVADKSRARLYKRVLSLHGFGYQIMEQVEIPAEQGFVGLPHLLSVIKLGESVADLRPVPQLLPSALPQVA